LQVGGLTASAEESAKNVHSTRAIILNTRRKKQEKCEENQAQARARAQSFLPVELQTQTLQAFLPFINLISSGPKLPCTKAVSTPNSPSEVWPWLQRLTKYHTALKAEWEKHV
jgi:hypothetical protein